MDDNFVENLRKKLGWPKPKAPNQAGHEKAKFLREYRKPSRRQAQEEGGGDLNDYFDFTSSSESETSFTNLPLSRMASNFNKKRKEMKRLANIKRQPPDKHQTSTMTSSISNSSKMKRPDHQTTMTTAASNSTHISLASFATTSSMLKPTPVGETKNKESSFTKPAVPAAPQPTTTSISNRTITMEKCIQTSPPQSSTPRPQKPPQPSTSCHKPLPQPELLMTSDEEKEEEEPSINHQDELVLTEDEDEWDGGDGSQNADFCEISIENTSNVFQNDKSYNRRSSDIYNKSERNSDDRPPSKVRRSLKYRTSSPSPNTSVQDQASGCHDDDAVAASHSEKRSTRKSHVSTKSRKSQLSRRSQAPHRSSHESTHISRRSQTSYRSSQEKSQESTRSRESGKSFTKTPASTRRKTPGTSYKTPAATRKTPEKVTGTKTPAPRTGTKTPAPVTGRKTPAPGTGTKTPAPVTGRKTPAPVTGRKTPAATIKTPAPGTDTKTAVAATTGKPSGRRLTRQSLKRASTEVKKQDSADIRSPRRKSRRRTFDNLDHEEEVADIRLPRPSTSQRQNTEIVVPPMEDVQDNDVVMVEDDVVQDNGGNDVVMVEDDDVVLLPQTPKPTKTRGSGSSDNFVHIREWLNNPEPPETPDKMSDIVVQEVVDAGSSASINISIGGYNEPGRPQLELSRKQLEGIIGMRTSSSEPNTSDNPSTSNQQPAPVMSNDIPSSPNIELPESPSVQIETVEEEVVVAEKSKISTRTTKNKSLAATNKSSVPIEIAGDEVVAEKSKLSTRTIKNKSLAAASKERSTTKKPPSTKKKAPTNNKSSVEVADDEEVVVDKSKTSSIKENKSLAPTNREKRANKKPPRQKKKTTTKNKETSGRRPRDRFAHDGDFQIDIIPPDQEGIEAGLRRSRRYRTRPLGVPWKGHAVYAEDRTLIGIEVGYIGEIRYVNDERKKLDGSDSDDTIVQNITDNQALDPIVEEPAENELVAQVQTVQENDEIGQNKDGLAEDVQQIEDNLAEDVQQNEDIEQNEVDLVEDVGQNEVEDVGQDVDDDADIEHLSPTNNNTIEQLPQINTSPPKARDFEYERDEDTDDLKTGFIIIEPKKQKPPAKVKHWKTNFMVFNGEVELVFPSFRRSSKKTSLRKKELVQKKTKSVTLKSGCHCTVPPNSEYSLHNHQQQLAKLAFVSVRDKDAQ